MNRANDIVLLVVLLALTFNQSTHAQKFEVLDDGQDLLAEMCPSCRAHINVCQYQRVFRNNARTEMMCSQLKTECHQCLLPYLISEQDTKSAESADMHQMTESNHLANDAGQDSNDVLEDLLDSTQQMEDTQFSSTRSKRGCALTCEAARHMCDNHAKIDNYMKLLRCKQKANCKGCLKLV
eukprot:TCONS_00049064-protein